MDYDKELESLKEHLKKIDTAFIKCSGAIEFVTEQKRKAEESKKDKGK